MFWANGLQSGGHQSQHLRSRLGDRSIQFQAALSGSRPPGLGKTTPHHTARDDGPRAAHTFLGTEFYLTFYYGKFPTSAEEAWQELPRAHSQLKDHQFGHSISVLSWAGWKIRSKPVRETGRSGWGKPWDGLGRGVPRETQGVLEAVAPRRQGGPCLAKEAKPWSRPSPASPCFLSPSFPLHLQ